MCYLYFIIAFFIILPADCTDIVCSTPSHDDECQLLQRDNKYQCQKFFNKLDCVMSINNYTANVGTISPDEALLANPFVENINVIASTAPIGNYEDSDDTIVVLVKNKTKSFEDLRGLKMCHPGYGKLKLPRYYLNKFDEKVLDMLAPNRCQAELDTVIAKRYSGLSKVFGDSCYPGPWAYDKDSDSLLKSNYPTLCAACTTTETDKCSTERISDPFESAMQCFYKNGDVVLTTYNTWDKHKDNLKESYFLCQNGTSIITSGRNECLWGSRPKHLLVADSQRFDEIQSNLVYTIFKEKIIGSRRKRGKRATDLSPYLNSIIFPSSSDQLLPVKHITLKKFLEGKDSMATINKCDNPIKWCTISPMEQQKCLWFRQATINQGITPTVQCIEASNQLECIKKINSKQADITNINNNYSYAARKYGLMAIAYPETDKSDLTKSMIIVKNFEQYTSLNDLKNKFGCFAQFGDIAFMSFVRQLENTSELPVDCDGSKITDFVGNSCAPGVKTEYDGNVNKVDADKMCHCESTVQCDASENNKYYGNEGALQCLNDKGDFAVITNKDLNLSNIGHNNYTVLCKNGTLSKHSGLEVDDDCYLTLTTNTELVIRLNDPNMNNIIEGLHAFEVEFGQKLEKSFQLFNIFNGTKDLLFKDSTPGLSPPDSKIEYISNYRNLFKEHDGCAKDALTGTSNAANSSMCLLLLLILNIII